MSDLKNPHTASETIALLKDYMVRTQHPGPLKLLEKAISKAREEIEYAFKLEETLRNGSTIEYRELFAPFGDYWKSPYPDPPEEAHCNHVNAIDSAMHHIKLGDVDSAIDDYNFLHNR